MPEGMEIADEFEHPPTYVGPPNVADLVWREGRVIQTRYGERRLAKASLTPEFRETWKYAAGSLRKAGFQIEDYSDSVLYWERLDIDRDELAELVDSLPDVIARGQAEDARIEDERRERQEREAAALQAFIEEAREAARQSLRTRRWTWAKNALIDEAQALIDDAGLDRTGAVRLMALTAQAHKNVVRGEQRIAIRHEPEMVRATDPEIVAAARAAVIDITTYDADWALLRNDIGWSRATTVDGHILAGLDAWTPEQASHALRLLRVHRKQVPSRLEAILFPTLSLSSAA
ncbi:hypothetical protein [Methylobacterium sp. SD21]|uniref:hypothetical protein n=1 Tax=Methylobacterium litchii TaxID=3138810 RepID=UPI00313CEC85